MSSIAVTASATGTGTVTLLAPVTNMDRTITLPDVTGTAVTTGSTAVVSQAMLAAGVAGNGPAFSAYKNSGAQSITTATFTKLTFDTEDFDTNSNFTSSRFTPTVAGYYQISAGLSTSGSGAQTRALLSVYKNGSPLCTLQDLSVTSFRYGGSILAQMNGTTDYLEIYAYIVGTSLIAESGLGGTGYNTFFQAAMIRSA